MKSEVPMIRRFRPIALVAGLSLLPVAAMAQGHMLHGAGPVNSSMGGAGTALLEDSVGALMFNPALLAKVTGNQVTFSTEFFEDAIRIDTTIDTLAGTMEPTQHLGVIPAFGWMSRHPDKKLALGFGLIGVAGFRTDYFQSNESLLFSQPPSGFGRIYTDYRLTKIPIALAYQVSPKLSLGASLNVYYGQFSVAPLPYQVFDLNANGDRYYPGGGNLVSSWSFAPQLGFHYQATPKLGLAASITTPQNFDPYEWNSTFADPASPRFGLARRIDFDLDGPLIVSFGSAFKLGDKTDLAMDGMFTKYKGVEGFGSPGGIVDGIVYPFGWRNVWTFKIGARHRIKDKLDLRLGYNYSQTPLREEVILTGTGAPATFEHHFCGGFGYRLFPFVSAEASFYYVPRKHLKGPLPNLDSEVIGTLDTSNQLTSALIGLNFTF
ncbi:MAG: OmpP1/FadL family transporter [Vicinamibacteria bacterium]